MQPTLKPQKKQDPTKPFIPAGSAKNQFENLGKATVGQIGEATVSVAKDIPAQLFGQVPTQEQLITQQRAAQEKAAEKRQKEVRVFNALQSELQDIQNQDEQERLQKFQVEEQQKAAQEQQAAQQAQVVEEPTSAPKKGLMGGQARKRKQTQMETGKVMG